MRMEKTKSISRQFEVKTKEKMNEERRERVRSLHRERNRESMRRNRLKNKGKLTRLREMVHELEQVLSTKNQQQKTLSTSTTAMITTISNQKHPPHQKYLELMDLIQKERHTNLLLKEALVDKIKLVHRIETLFSQLYMCENDLTEENHFFTNTIKGKKRKQTQQPNILSMNEGQVLVKTCEQEIQVLKQSFEKEAMMSIPMVLPLSESTILKPQDATILLNFPMTFGWYHSFRTTCDGQGTEFYFYKFFPHTNAPDLLKKTWEFYGHAERFQNFQESFLSSRVLQNIDDQIFVMVHEQIHATQSLYLRFRCQLTNGNHVIARKSLEQKALDQKVHEIYWMEFEPCVQMVQNKLVQGCKVIYCGVKEPIDMNEQVRQEASATTRRATLISILRWETNVMTPIPMLT